MPAPIEKKTIWATLAGLGIGVSITLLTALQDNAEILGSTPSWLQWAITTSTPPMLTFLAAYQAPHTERPDLNDSAEVRRLS